MAKLGDAISQIEQINNLNQRDQWINSIHPLVKLSLSVFFIITTVSFDKYVISSLLVMAVYPWFVFTFGELNFRDCIYRIRLIIPIVCLVGIFNPIIDRTPMFMLGGVIITSGMISMVSLIIKGILTVLAAYLLIVTTTIEDICYSLRLIRVPKTIVTIILLIYRYLFMLIREVEKVTIAYKLRAPGQNGIHISAWGSLVGQILLRSMDRAETIYQAMALRGFDGDFIPTRKIRFTVRDGVYLVAWIVVLLIIRNTSVINMIGGLLL